MNFAQLSYPFMFLLVTVWALTHFRSTRALQGRDGLKALLIALLLVGIVLSVIQPRFRIFADELELAAAAKAMYMHGSAAYVAEQSGGEVLQTQIDNRPLLYPFLVHLSHHLCGFRLDNSLALNGALFIWVLLLVQRLTSLGGASRVWPGLSAALLVLSSPVVALCAASGGYELLTLALILLAGVELYRFVEQAEPQALNRLVATLLLLSYTRPEAVLYLPITLGGLMLNPRLRRAVFRSPMFYSVPFLLAPVIWHRLAPFGAYEISEPRGLFSLERLIETQLELLRAFAAPFAWHHFSLPVLALGLYGAVLWIESSYRRGGGAKLCCGIVFAGLAAHYLLLSAHQVSFADDPVAARYYLPHLTALGLAAAAALLCKAGRRGLGIASVLFISMLVGTRALSTLPVGLFGARFDSMRGALAQAQKQGTLIVGTAPFQYILLGFDAVSPERFTEMLGQNDVPLEYRNIYFVQYRYARAHNRDVPEWPVGRLRAVEQQEFKLAGRSLAESSPLLVVTTAEPLASLRQQ